ncbi:MAG: GHKL domain-containing protein [Defluviitaleaceae bacterium]|nr:GHKL domain-containing protein [Defluviitaleaceae bacterium]
MTKSWIMAFALMVLFGSSIKKEMALKRSKAHLIKVNDELMSARDALLCLKEEIVEKEAAIKMLDGGMTKMENLQQRLRDFKHGQHNLLIALAGSMEGSSKAVMDDMLEQYSMRVNDVSKDVFKFAEMSQLKSAELWPIRKLLLAKIARAEKEGVSFTLEAPEDIHQLGMPILDFVDILGVWLDNAIEEAAFAEEKWVHTSFLLNEKRDGKCALEVRVSNGCRQDALSPEEARKRGVSTKGENRGFGLAIVNERMEKNEHVYVNTEILGTKYLQLLEIEWDTDVV